MKIVLQPEAEYHCVFGEGKNFGEAAMDLLNKVCFEFSVSSLNDGILFEALSKLQEHGEFIYSAMPDDEESFTLTLEN
jgi:hypothetical protein